MRETRLRANVLSRISILSPEPLTERSEWVNLAVTWRIDAAIDWMSHLEIHRPNGMVSKQRTEHFVSTILVSNTDSYTGG